MRTDVQMTCMISHAENRASASQTKKKWSFGIFKTE